MQVVSPMLKQNEMYAGQLKTGPVSLTEANKLAIAKDAELHQSHIWMLLIVPGLDIK